MSDDLAAVRIRPIADNDDAIAAGVLYTLYDETQQLETLVPGGKAYRAVAIAEDESLAVFDAYPTVDWETIGTQPLARVVITRSKSALRSTPNARPDPNTSTIPSPPMSFEMLSDGMMPQSPGSPRQPQPKANENRRTPNPQPDPRTSVIPEPPRSFEMLSGPMPRPAPSNRIPRQRT
jgi:hypothetical protein